MKKTQENFKAMTQFTDLTEKELKKVIGGDFRKVRLPRLFGK